MELSRKYSQISASPTLAIDTKLKEMRAAGINVVGFGAGEPDFDTPQYIKDAAKKALDEGKTKYTPASGTMTLKKAICEKLKRENNLDYEPSQIIVSNGAKHSLTNVFGAILNPGDEVIIPAPFWVSYPEMIKLADGVPVFVDADEAHGFKITAKQLEEAITPRTKAFLLNSPSNPTGMVYTKPELEEIARICVKNNIFVVSDEIYEHLIYEGERISIASLGDDIKKLTIIVNGMSKTFSMTGWRIGYTASEPEIAKVMSNVQSHATSNPNTIAQYAAEAALKGSMDFVEAMKKEYMARRNYMVERINSIGSVLCSKPQGAFYVMMNIKNLLGKEYYGKVINTSSEFAAKLLETAKVAMVPGEGFHADGYLRLSYAVSMETIKEGLDRFEKFIRGECK